MSLHYWMSYMSDVQKGEAISETIPEAHKSECTNHETYQYGHETNATLQWVHTYFGAVM